MKKFLSFIGALLLVVFNIQAQCDSQESISSTGASQSMSDGSTVTISSLTNAQSNRLNYAGVDGYWMGDGNSDESILFSLSNPTTEITICASAHSCNNSTSCEHFKLNVNGDPYTFDPNNLTLISGDCAIVDNGTSISETIRDGCGFCYDVTLQSGINNFEIIHDNLYGSPSGTVYDPIIGLGCFPAAAVPTLSQWGIIVLCLFILIFGVVGLKKRELALR